MTQSTIENFNPAEHIVQIKAKDGSLKDYLPASWRLYWLRLLYPQITIESEIIHLDVEHNLVVVKAWIFDGATYAESQHRASSYKQGLLSALDRVETGAKARASRDFGIGTELALDIEAEDVEASGNGKPAVTLAEVKDAVKSLGLVHNPAQWQAWKRGVLGKDVPDGKLTLAHIKQLEGGVKAA